VNYTFQNLDEPNFEVTKKLGLLPNTLFNVTIQAFTYWAMASPTNGLTLRSPKQGKSKQDNTQGLKMGQHRDFIRKSWDDP